MKQLFMYFCFNSLLIFAPVSFGQTKIDTAEITSSVPELTDFHEIIYPMWHNAFPAKDYEALKGFVPQIKSSVESINGAKLPGILREREAEWKSRLDELNVTAQNYYKAAGSNDNEALLAAAERLHSVYERMNRVIRPVIKEIDDYHQSLYIIYHKLYPEKKFDEIAGMAGSLVEKAEAIKNFPQDRLKQRLGDKVIRFDSSAKELYNATISLKEAMNGNDPKKKDEAILSVHSAYQGLDAVFH